jgi:Holliday junction resolvase RusA-like endonuclease
MEGPLEVYLVYGPDGVVITVNESPHAAKTLTGDLDNYVKLTCDALNGVAWEDDRQIVRLMAVKVDRFDHSEP